MATPTTPNLHAPAGSSSGLHRVITLRHAVALYVSSLLGSGIFIIPGLAARIAGPASILSWIILSVASYPFAYTFRKSPPRHPGPEPEGTRSESNHPWNSVSVL